MFKQIILSIFIVASTICGLSQECNEKNIHSMENFLSVRISSGYTTFGTQSISLQREGLICWNHFFLDGRDEKATLIPFEELSIKKVWEVMDYIYQNNLLEYSNDSLAIPPRGFVGQAYPPTKIVFIIYAQDRYKVLYYYYCDNKIDKLIQMMNDLVPLNYKEFRQFCRCKYKNQ